MSQELIQKIIKSNKSNVRIVDCVSLYQNATVTFSKKTLRETPSTQERYYLELLNEHYREIKFYLVQYKLNNKDAENRLDRSLIAIAQVLNLLSETGINVFFEDISDDVECSMFITSSFTDFPGAESFLFIDRIKEDIRKTKTLSDFQKNGLKYSRAKSLVRLVKSIDQSNTKTKEDLLQILAFRHETDEQINLNSKL